MKLHLPLATITALIALIAFNLTLVKAPIQSIHAESHPVTWRSQVAPIVYANCAGCHHAGGSGPFDLTTYASARRWAPQIAEVVQSRYMPPWLPEPNTGPHAVEFEGNRRLKASDIDLLTTWVKAGVPEGAGPEPVAPVFHRDWQMGPPDLVLEMPVAVTEPASGSDIFVNFILPAHITGTRWVRAMEIQPDAGQLVHHANVVIDRNASLRAAHPADWQAGIAGMDLKIDSGDAFDPDSHFLFWKPDSTALIEPPGMPWRLDQGNDLVLNMHLKPTGKPEQVRARIGLYFAATPAVSRPLLIQLEHDAALDIPAGDANFVVTDELKLPVDVDLLGVYPHAHYLGREMEAWATLPSGERRGILGIKHWDIDRQAVYRLAKPLPLPAGTVVHMRYVYDNSAANIHNPSSPPVRVEAGNRATDEMGHLWLQVLPHTTGKGDPRLPLEGAWMESILRKSPNDPFALYNLGALSQMGDQPAQAATYFRRLLNNNAQDPRALTALGSALEATGDNDGARAQYGAALALDSNYADATFDLALLDLQAGQSQSAEPLFRKLLAKQPDDEAAIRGLAQCLISQNKVPEAESMLRDALARWPGDADAHRLLATVYSAEGQATEMLDEVRAWARLSPDQPEAHRALAQVLSLAGEGAGALAEEQTVVRLSPGTADDWNDLGVMEARAGDHAEAQRAFEHALQLDTRNQAAKNNLAGLSPGAGVHAQAAVSPSH